MSYNPCQRFIEVQSQAPFRDARPRDARQKLIEERQEWLRLIILANEAPNRLFGAYHNERGEVV